jgi:hypothetical protein
VIDFSQPVTAGTVLVRSAIQSPNYAAGSAGWSINQSGSAEFNNLTLRGTFVGSNYVQNSAGEFLYSATPGPGVLAISLAPQAGTDAYGNAYPSGLGLFSGGVLVDRLDPANGLTSMSASQYVRLQAAGISFGAFNPNTGTLTPDGAEITDTALGNPYQQGLLNLHSPSGAGSNRMFAILQSGYTTVASGQPQSPRLQLLDEHGNSAADLLLSGNAIATDLAGNARTWQTPAFAAGYTNANCEYRLMPYDAVHWGGEFSQTTGVASGGSATVYTLPAGYRPAKERIVPVSWRTSTGASKGGNAFLAFETSGAVILGWSAATANGDRFSCEVDIPLNIVP